MERFYMGVILFVGGALAVFLNKKAARAAVKVYYKHNYKLVGKDINEKVGRTAYIVSGLLLMAFGLLMILTYFTK